MIAGFDALTSIDYQMAAARARQAEQERDAAMAKLKLTDERARDLDETRRLLYMALLHQQTEPWHELAGTLVNSLAHHGLDIPAEESMAHLGQLGIAERAEESEAWAWALINRITAELDQ